jgi:hypothetical protein
VACTQSWFPPNFLYPRACCACCVAGVREAKEMRPLRRARIAAVLVGLLTVQTAAQCGPDKDKPYPPGKRCVLKPRYFSPGLTALTFRSVAAGSTTCPPAPAEGGAAAGGEPASAGGSGNICDVCGASATYAEVISESGGKKKRTITASGCPNHYSVCTGKPVEMCADIGKEGTATQATDQSKTIEIPAEPVLASTTPLQNIKCAMGAIAIALNGVSIYGGAVDQTCKLVETGVETSEWTSFDMCAGHSQRTGDYHYHFPPSCLLSQATATKASAGDVKGHSPQIGWSFDGECREQAKARVARDDGEPLLRSYDLPCAPLQQAFRSTAHFTPAVSR